jgi:hypothetical protein
MMIVKLSLDAGKLLSDEAEAGERKVLESQEHLEQDGASDSDSPEAPYTKEDLLAPIIRASSISAGQDSDNGENNED